MCSLLYICSIDYLLKYRDDEYIKLKKRELEKLHQDLMDFSYLLEVCAKCFIILLFIYTNTVKKKKKGEGY